MTVKPTPPGERLARRLVLDPSTGCLNWTGPTLHNGYGQMGIPPKVNGRTPRIRVHRLAYELAYGPIPEGMHIDHLCRNRLCCNPQHLEVVTPGENTRRGNSPSAISARTGLCQKGHVMDEVNTLIGGTKNTRACRKCQLARKAEYLRRRRALLRMNTSSPQEANATAAFPRWRPIETAPKDGTPILLYCPKGDGSPGSAYRVTCGQWEDDPGGTTEYRDAEGRWTGQDDREGFVGWLSWDGGFSEDTMMPTHWMPLPPPPESGAAVRSEATITGNSGTNPSSPADQEEEAGR